MATRRERELLYGLLALELGFVRPEAFRECAALWIARPRGSLGALLRERGGLGDQEAQALGLLVEAHIRRHGSPEASLGTMRLPKELRDSLAQAAGEGEAGASIARTGEAAGHSTVLVTRAPEEKYELGEEIGRGGLGRVVAAKDRDIGREVALKLMLEGAPSEWVARFRFEGSVTGRLQHPHIVPVYDVGVLPDQGRGRRQIYFAMKRIEGVDMGRVLRELGEGTHAGPWTRRRLVEALRDVCRAVAYAHSKGVIHRDLKPSNVMLGEFGEVLVVDWGLAKVSGSEDGRCPESARDSPAWATLEGEVMGTPAYMPPEQAEGRIAEVDARSDVYALGAMLYEVLCYRPPYSARSAEGILTQVLTRAPLPPSERRTAEGGGETVPEALEAICLRAMAREKAERYARAQDLADELSAWLEGAKDRERQQKNAEAAVAEGERLRAEWEGRKGQVQTLKAEVERLGKEVPAHAPVEAKRTLWDARRRLREARTAVTAAFGAANAAYGAALTAVSDHAAARAGKCALFLARYLEAEKAGNDEGRLLNRQLVQQYDPGGWTARLDPRGTLSLSTAAHACDCLRPLLAGVLEVRFAEDCRVPWREGQACPGEALGDEDRPVPALTLPEGVSWGHGPGCERRPVEDATVRLSCYEEEDERLRPVFVRELGRTPITDVELPGGSYLCELTHPGYAPVRLPARIDRDGAWRQDVTLYRADEIPAGFCYVPGGPFRFGEERAGVGWREERRTQDLFVARVGVTVGEYIEFLNDLDIEEARSRAPRDGETRFLVEEGGRFRLHRQGEGAPVPLSTDCPVLGVSWFDALACSAWRSRRDGRVYRLLHEEEFEKAARGVDGRTHPWGERYDGTFSNTTVSHAAGPRPVAAGSFEVDESPYGIRDLAGNMETCCLNAPENPYRQYCLLRGGAWNDTPDQARATHRGGDDPADARRGVGLRWAVSPSSPSPRAS
ncbi:MAG: SUMF1/EgtB/PvdO family nonheme iron enzyme [Planctomycetes bacterium]|nr:SUMF1/EgtB/PvdO family nonheme iron enzyme [Planctomycetota bacterium]